MARDAHAERPQRRTPSEREQLLKFVRALSQAGFTRATPEVRRHLEKLFDEPDLNYQGLVNPAISVLKLGTPLSELLASAMAGDHEKIYSRLKDPDVQQALDDGLLHCVLRQTICNDHDFELLLCGMRKAYLRLALDFGLQQDAPDHLRTMHLRTMVSLASQCFNNEYVWVAGQEEKQHFPRLSALLARFLEAAGDAQPAFHAALAVAGMYQPLAQYSFGARLREIVLEKKEPELEELLHRQLYEPYEEIAIQAAIASLGNSVDATSEAVRRQYEQFPYPRWLNLTAPEPRPFLDVFQSRFPFLRTWPAVTGSAEVLIAGCGTGQHPLWVALQYTDANVVGVDISRPSLAYAIRKARQHGVGNLEFHEADILCLRGWNRRFHAIEASGVLHHMADPALGLEVLSGLLLPGGFLNIGLYSRRGRARLAAARRRVAQAGGASADNDTLREIRLALLHEGRDVDDAPCKSLDFYSLSGFRDLLGHVHELHFDLNEVSAMIARLGLVFLGFDAVSATLKSYREMFPGDPELRDLKQWDVFERENPGAFGSMYEFWVQKPRA